jgi:hypothetical protein
MYWILCFNLCDLDTLDALVRHCNWDPTTITRKTTSRGKMIETGGSFIMDASKEAEGQTYTQLQEMCPSVLNEKEMANMFRMSMRTAKMPKKRPRTPVNQRYEIYATELATYEEPLRAMIHRFREWMRANETSGNEQKAWSSQLSVYHPEENPHIVEITAGGPPTMHSFRQADMFVAGAFSAALKTDMEKSFTAVHAHLPKSLGGADGNSEDFEAKLTTLVESIIDATTQRGTAVKVHIQFVSWHANCLLDPKTEIH